MWATGLYGPQRQSSQSASVMPKIKLHELSTRFGSTYTKLHELSQPGPRRAFYSEGWPLLVGPSGPLWEFSQASLVTPTMLLLMAAKLSVQGWAHSLLFMENLTWILYNGCVSGIVRLSVLPVPNPSRCVTPLGTLRAPPLGSLCTTWSSFHCHLSLLP